MIYDKIIRKIAEIFVTDAVLSSEPVEQNEDVILKSLCAGCDVLDMLFEKHGGPILNAAGNSIFQRASKRSLGLKLYDRILKTNWAVKSNSPQRFADTVLHWFEHGRHNR
jgi:hypothetical protein